MRSVYLTTLGGELINSCRNAGGESLYQDVPGQRPADYGGEYDNETMAGAMRPRKGWKERRMTSRTREGAFKWAKDERAQDSGQSHHEEASV